GEVLPLRVNFGGTSPAGVVQQVPGIPTATAPAHLDEPRPDLLGGCIDGDGHGSRPLAFRDKLSAGIGPNDLLVGCPPARKPRPQAQTVPRPLDGGRHDDLLPARTRRRPRPVTTAWFSRRDGPSAVRPLASGTVGGEAAMCCQAAVGMMTGLAA